MADDSAHSPKPDLAKIIDDIDIPITARMPDKRLRPLVIPNYQTISDGQWHRPHSQRDAGDGISDGLGDCIGPALGPQPTAEQMQAATIVEKLTDIVQPLADEMARKAWIREHQLKLHPERKLLRRPIDMTIHYPEPVRNDRDHQASQPKVAPSKSQRKPDGKVTPRRSK